MNHSADDQIGVIGSPSSTGEIMLDIVGDAARRELLGSMVMLEQPLTGHTEVALGTVAEVTTENQWHEDISMRGVIANRGKLANLSGRADVRGAKVAIQAVYRSEGDTLSPAGATLSMSPSTGEPVYRANDKLLHQIVGAENLDVFYMGDLYRMPGVRLPLNPSDFSGARGAFHAGVFGPSGVGKSVFALYYLAGQMRHPDLGIFLIDPQGQMTIERPSEMPFSLQGLARGLGREVIVKALSTEIRLPQDKALFGELLGKTAFFRLGLTFRYAPALEAAVDTVIDTLEKTTGWPDLPIEDLLEKLLGALRVATENGDIYKDVKWDKQTGVMKPEGVGYKLIQALDDAIAHGTRWGRLFKYFEPVASLFSEHGPTGKRMKMDRLLHQVVDRQEGKPRPLIVLNLAFQSGATDDTDQIELMRQLNDESTKARILRTLFDRLEHIASRKYRERNDTLLNTLVVFDEAWRYAPKSTENAEIGALSKKLAEYARETRKYGLGWMYVLQSPHTLNRDVWDQLKSGFRALGYGLTGADLELVRAQVDRPESIQLYRSFPQPSEHSRQYPFMLIGAISPLSFTMAPLYTSVYTTFEAWCDANTEWLPEHARKSAEFDSGLSAPAPFEDEDDPFL